jgi:hypothetical protein
LCENPLPLGNSQALPALAKSSQEGARVELALRFGCCT